MAIKIRKFRKLNEADDQQQQQQPQQQQQQPQQQQQNSNQQQQQNSETSVPQNPNQQQNSQNGNQFNVNDFKNKVMNATDNVLKGTLENIARIMKDVPGVTQADNNIPESKEMSQLYAELAQKKDYGTLGKFLSGLNKYAQAVVNRVEGQNQNKNQSQQQTQPQQPQNSQQQQPAQPQQLQQQ